MALLVPVNSSPKGEMLMGDFFCDSTKQLYMGDGGEGGTQFY